MQVTYVNALDNGWTGITTGEKNPTFLFDTEDNRLKGGGSLKIGAKVMNGHFRKVLKRAADNPLFQDAAALDETALKAWARYNTDDTYPATVFGFVANFLPVSTGPVFPAGGGTQ